MGKKQLWMLIAGLVLLNCLTVIFFLSAKEDDVVATVGEEKITQQELFDEIENRYGKEVLKDLIDKKVIDAMTEKYDIQVSDAAVERELTSVKTMHGFNNNELLEEDLIEQIKYNLLLEEMLTTDVVISEEELTDFYEQNSSRYSIPTTYHISHIVFNKKKEAEQAIEELEQGSEFSTLAMEKSIDTFSANQGGDLGYVSAEDDHFPEDYLEVAKQLKSGEWSEPIQIKENYAVLFLNDKIQEKSYSFKEVKDEIRRELAINQMNGIISANSFWDEAKVEWLYDK